MSASGTSLFVVGDAFEVPMLMSPEVMTAFEHISADSSRVHNDASYAIQHGFKGPIVYGNLLGAMVSRLVGMTLPTPDVVIMSQSVNYRSPAYIGETVRLSATVASVHESVGAVKLTLEFSTRGSGVIATGLCAIKCL